MQNFFCEKQFVMKYKIIASAIFYVMFLNRRCRDRYQL